MGLSRTPPALSGLTHPANMRGGAAENRGLCSRLSQPFRSAFLGDSAFRRCHFPLCGDRASR